MAFHKFGRAVAREIYRHRYATALASPLLGPNHKHTRALFGRLSVYTGPPPSCGPLEIETVAWRRQSGDDGYWNRRVRRAFDERMRAVSAPTPPAPSQNMKPASEATRS